LASDENLVSVLVENCLTGFISKYQKTGECYGTMKDAGLHRISLAFKTSERFVRLLFVCI